MNALKLVTKEIKCDENGKGWISLRGLARLSGVDESSIRERINNLGAGDRPMFSSENNNLGAGLVDDIFAVKIIDFYAFESKAANAIAKNNIRAFAAIGLRTMIQMESGFNQPIRPTSDELLELKQAREKLSYSEIHEDSPKAVFKERNNNKVCDIKQAWIANGWMIRTPRLKRVFDESITLEGSDYLYLENGRIRVIPETKRDVLLITHGTLVGMHGQSDLLDVCMA